MNTRPTKGRLAPTPSGYLHLGNARSFLLAWLWARSEGGSVVMRVEDIDVQRCKPELREIALTDLAWLGLDWDEGPHANDAAGEYDQSTRFPIYRKHLQQLIDNGHAYPCVCSRKDIEEASSAPHGDEGAVYPGTCRDKWDSFEHAREAAGREPAWRFRWNGKPVDFNDELVGDISVDPSTLGDFVLWRRDDVSSYQLAVVGDDAAQGITQVLRGRDLLNSTARQLALYAALTLEAACPELVEGPRHWAHVPFIQDAKGRRMAKRDGDLALTHLREQDVAAERVIGFAAWSCGLLDELQPARPSELVAGFDLAKLNHEDFLVTDEHIAWLHS